jgi:hypothetical protein
MPNASLLHRLGVQYGTDKVQHHYLVSYDAIFEPQRFEVRRVLEIGVFQGASVLMWRDYFTHAHIDGMDMFLKAAFYRLHILPARNFYEEVRRGKHGERVTAVQCNHSDAPAMERFVAAHPRNYDVIIEDGSHMQRDQQLNMAQLLPLVRPGGIYVIEDLHTGLVSGFDELPSSENTTVAALLRLQETGRWGRSKYIAEAPADYLDRWIESVQMIATVPNAYTKNMLGVVRKRTSERVLGRSDTAPRVETVGWNASFLHRDFPLAGMRHGKVLQWNPFWDAATAKKAASLRPSDRV